MKQMHFFSMGYFTYDNIVGIINKKDNNLLDYVSYLHHTLSCIGSFGAAYFGGFLGVMGASMYFTEFFAIFNNIRSNMETHKLENTKFYSFLGGFSVLAFVFVRVFLINYIAFFYHLPMVLKVDY